MLFTWPLNFFIFFLDDRKPNMVRNPRWLSSQDKVFHVGPWENETRNVTELKQHMNNHWMIPYKTGEAIFIQVLLVTQKIIYW